MQPRRPGFARCRSAGPSGAAGGPRRRDHGDASLFKVGCAPLQAEQTRRPDRLLLSHRHILDMERCQYLRIYPAISRFSVRLECRFSVQPSTDHEPPALGPSRPAPGHRRIRTYPLSRSPRCNDERPRRAGHGHEFHRRRQSRGGANDSQRHRREQVHVGGRLSEWRLRRCVRCGWPFAPGPHCSMQRRPAGAAMCQPAGPRKLICRTVATTFRGGDCQSSLKPAICERSSVSECVHRSAAAPDFWTAG
jgi:hypothetical protein